MDDARGHAELELVPKSSSAIPIVSEVMGVTMWMESSSSVSPTGWVGSVGCVTEAGECGAYGALGGIICSGVPRASAVIERVTGPLRDMSFADLSTHFLLRCIKVFKLVLYISIHYNDLADSYSVQICASAYSHPAHETGMGAPRGWLQGTELREMRL